LHYATYGEELNGVKVMIVQEKEH